MSLENVITVVGNLADTPKLRYTQGGTAVADLRVAVSRRVNSNGSWSDRLDGYFDVTVWRDYAENVAESLHKGDRVMVTGRISQRSYEKEGQKRWAVTLDAEEVGPSLRWRIAALRKPDRASGNAAPPAEGDAAPAGELAAAVPF